MEINRTFFNYYLFHPLSPELDCTKQAVYSVATAILGLTTGGMFHLGTYLHLQKKVTPSPEIPPRLQELPALILQDIHLAPTSADDLNDTIVKYGKRIKSIDLRTLGLLIDNSHITKIIDHCTMLNHLFLATNISEYNLSRLWTLTELQTLDISCDLLPFPDLADFPNLKVLSLVGDLKDLPRELPPCPALEKLSLGSKTLISKDLPNVKNCINLKELVINNIRFFSLPSISSLIHLETLIMSHFDRLPDLNTLTELKTLSLTEFSTNFNESRGLETLKNLESLEIYAYGYFKLPDLTLYPNLKSLSLITTGGPTIPEDTVLPPCPKLERLTLGSIEGRTWLENTIKFPDLSPLINLKELTVKSINFVKLPGLNTLRHLEKLHLSNSNRAVLDDLSPLINLKHLVLRKLIYYTYTFHYYENTLKGLDTLKNLESLELCGFEKFPDLKCLSQLKSLKLEKCRLEKLDSLPHLEELHLEHMKQLALGNFPNLKKLVLHWCEFKHLNLTRFTLTSLDLYGCEIKYLIGLQTLTLLERLYLFDYNGNFPDLGDLSSLKALKELIIHWGKMKALQGLSALTNLRRVELDILLSIEEIDLSGAARLESCEISSCDKLHTLKLPARAHSKITRCQNLEKK